MKSFSFAAVCAAALLSGFSASAQTARAVPVLERQPEGYEPIGVRLGAFMAHGKLAVGAEHSSNVLATEVNKQSDTFFSVQPEVTITSQWSRNMLSFYARGARREFNDLSTEDATDYVLGSSGYLEAGDSRIDAGAEFGQRYESRSTMTTPVQTAKPVKYDFSQANLGVTHTFNRVRVSGRVDLREFDFSNGRTAAGAFVLQDDRDFKTVIYTGRADYALRPGNSIFVTVAYNDRNFDLAPPAAGFDRDSTGYDMAVGAALDLSELVRGEAQVGYMKQEYDDARLPEVKGFSTRALVQWFPTELQTVTFRASREVLDATIPGSPGFLAGAYSIQLDHELLRNVTLSARGSIGRDDYKGIDRNDDRVGAYLAANYLMNRRIKFTLAYDYADQKSKGAQRARSYTDNRVSLTSALVF